MRLDGAARRRERRRKAWAAQLAAAPTPEALAVDPLSRLPADSLGGLRRAGDLVVLAPILLCAAIGAHVLFVAVIWAAGSLLGGERENAPQAERIEVAVIETESEPEAEAEAEAETETEAESETEAEPEPEPEAEAEAEPEVEPEPTIEPEPEEPSRSPPEKIAGLNIGSTIEGGSGPRFATGNTMRGKTARVARGEDAVRRAGDPGHEAPRNRRATRIPRGGVKLVKPERIDPVKPTYPPTLKAQAIEGNVLVEVRLDETGRVVTARVVEGAPHAEMNEEALAAARQERYRPATRDGEPVEYTLTYTVRFRLSDS